MMLVSTQEDFHRDALGSTKTILLLTVSMACLSPEYPATLLNGPANQTLPLD